MRDWLRRWLGVDSVSTTADTAMGLVTKIGDLTAEVVGTIAKRLDADESITASLLGKVERAESDLAVVSNALSSILALKDRITALETSTKSAVSEKPAGKRSAGWSSDKRAAQKGSEWGH